MTVHVDMCVCMHICIYLCLYTYVCDMKCDLKYDMYDMKHVYNNESVFLVWLINYFWRKF